MGFRVSREDFGIIGVFVSRRDHKRAKGDHFSVAMLDASGSAWIVQAGGQTRAEPLAPFDLAQYDQPAA